MEAVTEADATGLLTLPNELILDIAELLESIADLGALVATNRRLYQTLNYILYRRDAKQETGGALGWGARQGLVNVIRMSLAQGADLNAYVPVTGYDCERWSPWQCPSYITSRGKLTPLHLAIFHEKEDVAALLIEYGANTKARANEKPAGITTLHMASELGLVSTMQLLLKSGLRVGTTDKGSRTPLYHAVDPSPYVGDSRRSKEVSLLLQNGASVTVRDCRGMTPEEYHRRLPWANPGLDKTVVELLQGARAAMEMKQLDKARAKKKTKAAAQEKASQERARQDRELRDRRRKEKAANEAMRKAEMRRVQEEEAAAVKKMAEVRQEKGAGRRSAEGKGGEADGEDEGFGGR